MRKASVTEKELRKAWTAQGISKARQDAMIADVTAKAQPGAMVGPFRLGGADLTTAGVQVVLPGAEKASDATMAQRKADAPLRAKASQRPCDAGLFSDERNQTSLF